METEKKINKHISTFQIIILGFLGVVIGGSLLLMLPIATKDGAGANFYDAVFTATSAVCVTGLVVKDTATYWSGFGQGVILLLIQIGGMGVVTVAIAIVAFSGRKIGLMQRSTMQEAIAAPHVGGIVKMTKFIIRTVILIELIGAMLLSFVFCKEHGLLKGIWYAIFHSVSAFCNAGFDLMGYRGEFSSLTTYVTHPLLNITIMLLIIIGGIGFLTWDDIRTHKWDLRKYRMQSKVIFVMTLLLIFLPSFYFFFFEFGTIPAGERIWLSFFQSVTARTAGFNTADLGLLSEGGKFLFIMIMLAGGSPGSTAGGVKTTTIAVLFSSAVSVFRKKEHVHFFGRRIPEDTVRNAATIFLMYIMLFVTGGIIISRVEGVSLIKAFFETGSAVATVGLSLGLTTELHLLSRWIIIGLMFFGRVGALTLVYAALAEKNKDGSRYPQEKITVG